MCLLHVSSSMKTFARSILELVSLDQFSWEHFFYDPIMFISHCYKPSKCFFWIHNHRVFLGFKLLTLTAKTVQEKELEIFCNNDDKNNINSNNKGWYLFYDYMPDTVLCASTCVISFTLFKLRVEIVFPNGVHTKALLGCRHNGPLLDPELWSSLSALGMLHVLECSPHNTTCMLLLFLISALSLDAHSTPPKVGLPLLLSHGNLLPSFIAFTPAPNYIVVHLPKITSISIYIHLLSAHNIPNALSLVSSFSLIPAL